VGEDGIVATLTILAMCFPRKWWLRANLMDAEMAECSANRLTLMPARLPASKFQMPQQLACNSPSMCQVGVFADTRPDRWPDCPEITSRAELPDVSI
jgi:hypothetical protein